MTIYTAHWQLKQWPQGHTRVSISRGSPRWLPAGSYKTYRALAPGKWFDSVSPQEYLDLYNAEILGKLDPRRVVEELEALGPTRPCSVGRDRRASKPAPTGAIGTSPRSG
jgi:hypothetical protein